MTILKSTGTFSSGILVADSVDDVIGQRTKIGNKSLSSCAEFQSTSGAVVLPRMTTDEVADLDNDETTVTPGMALYDITLDGFYGNLDSTGWTKFAVAGESVTSVTGTANEINVTAGLTPVVSLANFGGIAGVHSNPASITFDNKGRASAVIAGDPPRIFQVSKTFTAAEIRALLVPFTILAAPLAGTGYFVTNATVSVQVDPGNAFADGDDIRVRYSSAGGVAVIGNDIPKELIHETTNQMQTYSSVTPNNSMSVDKINGSAIQVYTLGAANYTGGGASTVTVTLFYSIIYFI